MSTFLVVSLFLLGLVVLDAIGDGLRWIGKQVPHHIVEGGRELIWLSLVAYFMGTYLIVPMYITARIALFDPLINLVAGKGLNYFGSNSIYDKVLRWFASKVGEPGHLIWVIRVMCLVFFVCWMLTNANGLFK